MKEREMSTLSPTLWSTRSQTASQSMASGQRDITPRTTGTLISSRKIICESSCTVSGCTTACVDPHRLRSARTVSIIVVAFKFHPDRMPRSGHTMTHANVSMYCKINQRDRDCTSKTCCKSLRLYLAKIHVCESDNNTQMMGGWNENNEERGTTVLLVTEHRPTTFWFQDRSSGV